MAQLKGEGVFAKEIATAGKAYHSPMMEGAAPALKAALQKVIMRGFILNLLCNSNLGKLHILLYDFKESLDYNIHSFHFWKQKSELYCSYVKLLLADLSVFVLPAGSSNLER